MTAKADLPLLLVIDDLFGRGVAAGRNQDRANLCGQFLIEDVTGDEPAGRQRIKRPIAQAMFARGQTPQRAAISDLVQNDVDGTLRMIARGWNDAAPGQVRWAMVLLDLCFRTGRVTAESDARTRGMPVGNPGDDDPRQYFGLRLLEAIHERFPDLPVVILSSQPREEVSREFTRRGAFGFLARDAEDSPTLLHDYLNRHGLIPDPTGEMVGRSIPLLVALRSARVAAANRRNLLIRGETGTGKELLAGYIHRQRGEAVPFVEVNSPTLTPELFASELFGIEAGTATGVDGRTGLVARAAGGDLFLDEIKDMLPQVQAGILKVLEERAFTPVGSATPRSVDVRFLSATNADVEALVAGGRFRGDLLFRLREGGVVHLPPLRDRKEDIPLLAEKFVRDAERQNPQAMRREIDPDALRRLVAHDWPGNVRELRDCLFAAVNGFPDVEHLVSHHVRLTPASGTPSAKLPATTVPTQPAPEADTLAELRRLIREFPVDEATPDELVGQLPGLDADVARLVAGLFRRALAVTADTTPGTDGTARTEGVLTRAVKLVLGAQKLSTTQAADELKRQLRRAPTPEALAELLDDPLLRRAYELALSLRPPKRPRA